MKQRAAFLDLNGTLVLPIKPDSLNDLTLIEGVGQAIARLSRAGFLCPVVTIQSRIAKGLFSMEEFHRWFLDFSAGLRTCGAEIVGPYVCPHRFSEPCACKKPKTLLYEQAAREHGIDLQRSFVIGDCEVKRAAPYASFVAESLSEAANWILSRPNGPS